MRDDDDAYDCDNFFEVWKIGAETETRRFRATNPKDAVELAVNEGWPEEPTWQSHSTSACANYRTNTVPIAYGVRSCRTGVIWQIDAGLVMAPTFVVTDCREIPMPPTTHIVWGDRVLCDDLRLVDLDAWPDDQQRITLRDVYDGAKPPADACATCWAKGPGFVEKIMQIGRSR